MTDKRDFDELELDFDLDDLVLDLDVDLDLLKEETPQDIRLQEVEDLVDSIISWLRADRMSTAPRPDPSRKVLWS